MLLPSQRPPGRNRPYSGRCGPLALLGPHAMSALRPECAAKRMSDDQYEFMGSRPKLLLRFAVALDVRLVACKFECPAIACVSQISTNQRGLLPDTRYGV